MKKKNFNKNTSLSEIIEYDKRYAQILMGFGLSCFACPWMEEETIEDAALTHGIDLDYLLEKLNEDFED